MAPPLKQLLNNKSICARVSEMNRQKQIKEKAKKVTARHAQILPWGTPEKSYTDSGLWWFLNQVYTKDEHEKIGDPTKKLPVFDKQYMQATFIYMLHYPTLAIVKSRQIMVSWMLCSFALWMAHRRPLQLIMWQSKKEHDAQSMVTLGDKYSGRMSFIETHLDGLIQDPWIRAGNGNRVGELRFGLERHARGVPVPNYGSIIRAVPQGGDQVRQYTATALISDECAFQEDFGDAVTAASPMLAGGGRFIMASTVEPQSFYREVVHDYDLTKEPVDLTGGIKNVPLPKGMRTWTTRAGVQVLDIGYEADPEKDPDTEEGRAWRAEAARQPAYVMGGIHSAAWRREMEREWDVMGGQPVFPFAQNPTWPGYISRIREETAIGSMRFYAGFDYGSTNPSAFIVWGFDRSGQAYALWELYEPCENYKLMAEKIKACPYFKHLQMIVADPQMWAQDQQRKQGKVSLADMFREEGVIFTKGNHGSDYDIAVYFKGKYWSDPDRPTAFITSACPKLGWEAGNLRIELHRSPLVAARKNQPEGIVQKHNHAWDATALLFDKLPRGFVPKPIDAREGTLKYLIEQAERQYGRGRDRNYVYGS